MQTRWLAILLAAACGDNANPQQPPVDPTPDAPEVLPFVCDESKLPMTLAALPHVTDVDEQPDCGDYVMGPARCFRLTFEQPVQHEAAAGPKLTQQLFLIHRGCDRPTLVADWGYSNEYFFDDELSVLYSANALWIEHRYQGLSGPEPGEWDWTALTIRNGAADMHAIITAFRMHYGEHFVSTGASKGGITATYHHYLYPDDLDGAIPYVAPASRSRVDEAYQTRLHTNTFPPCAQQLRDAQVAALSTRRAMMITKLHDIAPDYEALLLEAMTASFDWAFWQYYGVQFCPYVPTEQTSDQEFFDFFYELSGFGGPQPPATVEEEMGWGALYYEWLTEQGFALQLGSHVQDLVHEPETLATMEDNFHAMFPDVTLPDYDGSLTLSVRAWARDSAKNLLLIYGQLDPWSGGAMDQPVQPTSARYFVPNATHGAELLKLPAAERAQALAHATRMFGVEPTMTMQHLAISAGANRAAIVDGHAKQLLRSRIVRRARR